MHIHLPIRNPRRFFLSLTNPNDKKEALLVVISRHIFQDVILSSGVTRIIKKKKIYDTQSAQISQKQDGCNIYAIMNRENNVHSRLSAQQLMYLDTWCMVVYIYIYVYTYIYYYIYIHISLFLWGENRLFLFERHRLPLFVNCDRQAVLCSIFVLLFCNCFVPFVSLISSPNCTLFFSVFVNFIFLISWYYLD